jgi:serine-aspartate repeat-containing protein C/D/E
VLRLLSVDPKNDAILRIPVAAGDRAVSYNFSEVKMVTDRPPPLYPPSPPVIPETPKPFVPIDEPPPAPVAPLTPPPAVPASFVIPGSVWVEPEAFTWHLSVIDAGQPRRDGESSTGQGSNIHPANFLPTWNAAQLNQAEWLLANEQGEPQKVIFGVNRGIPVTGDFNGDGRSEIGVFLDGLWFLDLNGNGIWDEGDLIIRLGKKGDRPITGDWDGDGKTDIGVYGPEWVGDERALAVEPGLPDADNHGVAPRFKNVPPQADQATVGWRTMKRTAQGTVRADLIDHVFRYGSSTDQPLAGDWNGDGVWNIGMFRDGAWYLDCDGNGRWSEGDVHAENFGQAGDVAVVGDWTGDGVTKLGVYRNGTFYLDTNGDRILDARDKVFKLGTAGDKPVKGDWNGDGIDEVGVYHDGVVMTGPQAAAPAPNAGPVVSAPASSGDAPAAEMAAKP